MVHRLVPLASFGREFQIKHLERNHVECRIWL
jgi:hypothetical protein